MDEPRRCGARLRGRPDFCKRWPLRGLSRCRQHGGLSRGGYIWCYPVDQCSPEIAKEIEAKRAAVIAAMVAGRRRWIAELAATGQKRPDGRRRKDAPPVSEEERREARAAAQRQAKERRKRLKEEAALSRRDAALAEEQRQITAEIDERLRIAGDDLLRESKARRDRQDRINALANARLADAGFW